MYGNNSGSELFIDLLENRNAGSTTDDAERWTVAIIDDFSGWQLFEFPFADFSRKEIGNGAPNDGLTLNEVHGWAFGTLGTGGPWTYYLDDVGAVRRRRGAAAAGEFCRPATSTSTRARPASVAVKLNRPMADDDPAQVSVDYATEAAAQSPSQDAGVHTRGRHADLRQRWAVAS